MKTQKSLYSPRPEHMPVRYCSLIYRNLFPIWALLMVHAIWTVHTVKTVNCGTGMHTRCPGTLQIIPVNHIQGDPVRNVQWGVHIFYIQKPDSFLFFLFPQCPGTTFPCSCPFLFLLAQTHTPEHTSLLVLINLADFSFTIRGILAVVSLECTRTWNLSLGLITCVCKADLKSSQEPSRIQTLLAPIPALPSTSCKLRDSERLLSFSSTSFLYYETIELAHTKELKGKVLEK